VVVPERDCLPHRVFAAEIVAALPERLRKHLRRRAKSGTAAKAPPAMIMRFKSPSPS